MTDRIEAQRRVDQIRAFRAELEALRAAGVSPLTAEQHESIRAYHDAVLARLATDYDVDRTIAAGQLSRGMRLASFFAGITLTAAVYSLVSRFWGRFDLPLQATLLCGFPLVALVGVELSSRLERTLYVASLFGVVAYGTYWLAVYVLSETLNIPLTPLPIWGGVVFGLSLALPYGFRLILAVTLVALTVAVAGSIFQAAGYAWTGIAEHLDVVTFAAFASTLLTPHLRQVNPAFGPVTRLIGFGIGLGGLLVMSSMGRTSLLAVDDRIAETLYQLAMLVASTALLFLGIRRRWNETVHLTTVMLTLFLLVRFFDWFWDVLPSYVFFLILAMIALAWLMVLRVLRTRITGRSGR